MSLCLLKKDKINLKIYGTNINLYAIQQLCETSSDYKLYS